MKKEDPQSIGEILTGFLNMKNIAIATAEGDARETWSKIVGPYILEATRDVFIKNGVMTLSFTKATVKAEIMMNKSAYISAMNNELGGNIIRSIRFL